MSSTKDLTTTHWELRYPLIGKSLPADHGHRLYGAMSRIVPTIHQPNKSFSWRMATIAGTLNGRGEILLNFWSYVAQIYLPLKINAKGEPKLHGYAIAIPDVRNLAAFCQHFSSILQQRDTEEFWGKPRSAIVHSLEEVGLDSLGLIYTYISQLKPELNIDELLFGVDVFHIIRLQDKPQSKPQILSIQRYPPNLKAIAEFTQLQDKLYDRLFRQQYWQNLIRDRPRIEGFSTLLRDLPTAETLKNGWFCQDFRTVFSPKNNAMEQK